jgi:hypothetical protein
VGLHNTVTGHRHQIETQPRAAAATAQSAGRQRDGGGGRPAAAGGGQQQQQQNRGQRGNGSGAAGREAAATVGAEGSGRATAKSTLEEWVLVVGLSNPGDKVRIYRARRVGARP